MNYWIFIVTEKKINNKTYKAEEIFNQRVKDKFWGIGEKTPNRLFLKKGDRIIHYIGLPKIVFAGTSTLASNCFNLDNSDKEKYSHRKEVYKTDYGVLLDEIDVWDNAKSVKELIPKLKFIENKEYWYSYFQGGVRSITEEDFRTIVSKREIGLVEQIVTSKDIESQTEFALETHLEEFIYQNWSNINWGSNLELYETEEQDGRQFPAGTWSIDFLAKDKDKNDLIVIELKRGKTSDSTVGQLLRYVNWVKENVAEKDQNVRGIIIARNVDNALNYSVKGLDFVEVKTYKIDFKLLSFK